jgi:hypothetical protein
MNKTNRLTTLLWALGLIAIMAFQIKQRVNKKATNPFSRPYTVQKIDEHEVLLIHKSDTITLYLENAIVFNEEVVFIK